MITEHEIEVRVRYQETDGQARVHHANFPVYFELARTEMLREMGFSYKKFEALGLALVISELEIKYYLAAEFDDLLKIHVQTTRAKGVRVEHIYRIYREANLLAEGRTLMACVDQKGKPHPLPEHLRLK